MWNIQRTVRYSVHKFNARVESDKSTYQEWKKSKECMNREKSEEKIIDPVKLARTTFGAQQKREGMHSRKFFNSYKTEII